MFDSVFLRIKLVFALFLINKSEILNGAKETACADQKCVKISHDLPTYVVNDASCNDANDCVGVKNRIPLELKLQMISNDIKM